MSKKFYASTWINESLSIVTVWETKASRDTYAESSSNIDIIKRVDVTREATRVGPYGGTNEPQPRSGKKWCICDCAHVFAEEYPQEEECIGAIDSAYPDDYGVIDIF